MNSITVYLDRIYTELIGLKWFLEVELQNLTDTLEVQGENISFIEEFIENMDEKSLSEIKSELLYIRQEIVNKDQNISGKIDSIIEKIEAMELAIKGLNDKQDEPNISQENSEKDIKTLSNGSLIISILLLLVLILLAIMLMFQLGFLSLPRKRMKK